MSSGGTGAPWGPPEYNAFGAARLPGMIGLEVVTASPDRMEGRVPITESLIAGTGYVWAPVVVGLADALSAYGCGASMPHGAVSFTTVELKTNFLGSARAGETITAVATPAHRGRTTQVWDSTVSNGSTGRTVALFRCTQLILYP